MKNKLWLLVVLIILVNPYQVFGGWKNEQGLLLHHAARVSSGNSIFSVECSGLSDGYYSSFFVVGHIQFPLSDRKSNTYRIEVLNGSDEILYSDSGETEEVVGIPSFYILKTADQVFTSPRQHPWFQALREGHTLKIYFDSKLSQTFSLAGSNKTILSALNRCWYAKK